MENFFNIVLDKRFIEPLLIIVFSFLVYLLLVKLIKKILKFKSKRINVKKQKTLVTFFINILRYIIIIIACLMILDVYGIDTKAIIASLGVVSLVLGLALQDMVKDLISGVAIVLDNTYNVGDWITINDFMGEVVSLGMKTTRIKAYSGDTLIVNNGSITQVINHTNANNMAIVDVNVAYEEDIEKVEKVLTKLCKDISKKVDNIKGEVTLLGIEKLADSSVVFRIAAEVLPLTQYQVKRDINKYVKIEFDKNNITIPYQQLVVHNG